MKYSLEKKFALTFSILIATIIFICWAANVLLLGRVYISDKENSMMTMYRQLDNSAKEYDVNSDEFRSLFDELAAGGGLDILILNQDMSVIASNFIDENQASERLLSYFFKGNKDAKIIVKRNNYTLQMVENDGANTRFIELWGALSNGYPIVIRSSVTDIRYSVKIANMLLAYIGALALLFGYLIVTYITKTITRPILDIVNISDKMAKLDFDAKYVGDDQNEIGLLGEHINSLSSTLEKTVSELKSANSELERELLKRKEIDEMRTEFISNVSHELKTPIALIEGYAEGLTDCVNDDEESRNFYCEVIADEAKKMDTLVKNLLHLNELEYSKAVEIERINIVDFIKNCISNFDILIKQNDISTEFDDSAPIYVWSDGNRLEQVINNYLSNAIHYVKGEEKLIKIWITSDNNKVRVSVFNTGDRIPDESVNRLFEKFYKVDKARTREYGGSGVGLSIVKASMDALNQKYGVINHENGVEFFFEADATKI